MIQRSMSESICGGQLVPAGVLAQDRPTCRRRAAAAGPRRPARAGIRAVAADGQKTAKRRASDADCPAAPDRVGKRPAERKHAGKPARMASCASAKAIVAAAVEAGQKDPRAVRRGTSRDAASMLSKHPLLGQQEWSAVCASRSPLGARQPSRLRGAPRRDGHVVPHAHQRHDPHQLPLVAPGPVQPDDQRIGVVAARSAMARNMRQRPPRARGNAGGRGGELRPDLDGQLWKQRLKTTQREGTSTVAAAGEKRSRHSGYVLHRSHWSGDPV